MIELTLEEVLEIHDATLEVHGGLPGIRDEGALASAIGQPYMAMFGADLYPTLCEKAATLCFSLIKNHAFVDGNKRVGLLALSVFLLKNGVTLEATNEEAEQMALSVADSSFDRKDLLTWIEAHISPTE
jgi:death-on-curing protein